MLGAVNAPPTLYQPLYSAGNLEKEELQRKLDAVRQENRSLKQEVANLTEAIRTLEERGESQMRTGGWAEAAELDRARFEELAIRLARMFERIEQAANQGTESDLMLRLVQCTQERCKIERQMLRLQRQILDNSRTEGHPGITLEMQMRELENAIENITVEERRIEGFIL